MPSTVDLPVLVEVNEINQELIAGGACEARWVPTLTRSCSWSKHHHLPSADVLSTLKRQNFKQSASNSRLLQHKTLGSNTYVFTGCMKHRPWQQFQSSSPEGFFLSLHAKHVKLLLLFFAERLAVSHLREMFKTCYSERSPCGPHAGFWARKKSIDGELEKVLMELDKYKCIKVRQWKETENQPGI